MPIPRILAGDRAPLIALIGMALLMRALIPTGWMPVFDEGGVRLEICGAWSPPPAPVAAKAHHDDMAHAPTPANDHDQHDDNPQGGDQPCAFAATGLAWTGTDPLPTLALPARPVVLAVVPQEAGIGRGLAAPPPPATGPPLLS